MILSAFHHCLFICYQTADLRTSFSWQDAADCSRCCPRRSMILITQPRGHVSPRPEFFTYKTSVNRKPPPTCLSFGISNFWPDFWTHSTVAAGNTPPLRFSSKLLLQCCSSPCSLASNCCQNMGFFPVLFLWLRSVIGLTTGNKF
jgi:hypothetical protein